VDVRAAGGFIVAPPSQRPGVGDYRIIRGSLADLERLPRVVAGALPLVSEKHSGSETGHAAQAGERNSVLWRLLMVEACCGETVAELESRALILNEARCDPPLDYAEVVKCAASAWRYNVEGRNQFGKEARVYVERSEIEILAQNPDAAVLLLKLRGEHHGMRDDFAISPRAMAGARTIAGWSEKRIRSARDFLLGTGRIVRVHAGGAGRGDPNRYAFAAERVPKRTHNTNKHPLSVWEPS
jgi:hypothetical protein